jgi:hypothetical protein
MDEKITVSVGDEHVGRLEELAEELKAAGMSVDQVLKVGVITGSVPPERRSALEQLPGVTAVEGEQTYQLPPPDSEIQ